MRLGTTPAAISLPALGRAERVAIAALPAAAIVQTMHRAALATSVPPMQRVFALAGGIFRWLIVFAVLQLGRRLHKQSSRLVSEREAAIEGSAFANVAPGVVLHHILSPPSTTSAAGGEARGALLVHFAHGFGANALTWSPLFASLRGSLERAAPRTALTLAAHDRLGFGLSPRA